MTTRIVSLGLLVLVAWTGLAYALDEARIQREIDDIRQDLRQALHRHDAAASVACYADDCLLFPLTRRIVDNRAQLLAEMQYALDLGLHDFRVETLELIGDGEQFVVEIGRCQFFNGLGEHLNTVRFMTVWKRVDGKLKIYRDIAC